MLDIFGPQVGQPTCFHSTRRHDSIRVKKLKPLSVCIFTYIYHIIYSIEILIKEETPSSVARLEMKKLSTVSSNYWDQLYLPLSFMVASTYSLSFLLSLLIYVFIND